MKQYWKIILVWNAIKPVVTSGANAVKTVVTTVFNAIKSVVTTIWNSIKTVIQLEMKVNYYLILELNWIN